MTTKERSHKNLNNSIENIYFNKATIDNTSNNGSWYKDTRFKNYPKRSRSQVKDPYDQYGRLQSDSEYHIS